MVPSKNVGQENEVVLYVSQIAKWHFSMAGFLTKENYDVSSFTDHLGIEPSRRCSIYVHLEQSLTLFLCQS